MKALAIVVFSMVAVACKPYHETPEFDAELQAALEKNLASMPEIEALKKTARDVCEPRGVECFEKELTDRTEVGDL